MSYPICIEPILPITASLKRRWWDDSEDHSDFDRLDDCNGRGSARSVSDWVIISYFFVFIKWIRVRTMTSRWLYSEWYLSSLCCSQWDHHTSRARRMVGRRSPWWMIAPSGLLIYQFAIFASSRISSVKMLNKPLAQRAITDSCADQRRIMNSIVRPCAWLKQLPILI